MKTISADTLSNLTQEALQSPRLRANLNLHPELSDPVQRLAIAMEPGTYVQPHRHPQTFELLYSLRGRFLVLHFDEAGVVTGRTVLGEDCTVIENPAGQWHAVLSLDSGGVIFEVKHGPYRAVTADDVAPWAAGLDASAAERLNAWYQHAKVGDRAPDFSR